jgi:hypothetical protein
MLNITLLLEQRGNLNSALKAHLRANFAQLNSGKPVKPPVVQPSPTC